MKELKKMATILVIVLLMALCTNAFAVTCPNCNQNTGKRSCSNLSADPVGEAWKDCGMKYKCIFKYIWKYSAINCSSCGYYDNANSKHRHELKHTICAKTTYNWDYCPY